MKNRFTRIALCTIITLLAFAACEKVSSLENSALVENITITGCTPSQVVFAAPIIKGNTIELPLIYGKYLFPLTISLDVQASAGCTQILGFDEDTSYTFEKITDIRKLYSVAVSGATTLWQLKIIDGMSSESAEIVRAGVVIDPTAAAIIAPIARIDEFEATVTFQGLGKATYPLTLTPELTLNDGASFTEELPKQLTFQSAEDLKEFTVEAASGRTKIWHFAADFVEVGDNSDIKKLTEEQIAHLTIAAAGITFSSSQAQLLERNARFKFDKKLDMIDLSLKPTSGAELTFPLRATILLPVHEQALLIAPVDNIYEFSSCEDQKQVWVVDKTSGLLKCWTLGISPEMNADIKSYTITTFTSALSGLTVDKEHLEIDHAASRIIIPVDNGKGTPIEAKDKLTLKINMDLELYPGSICSAGNTSHTYITNSSSIYVQSTNGLLKRSWTVFLKDINAAPSSDKTLNNILISKYSSKDNRMMLYNTSFSANNTDRSISIKITNGIDAFPLVIAQKSIKPKYYATKVLEAEIANNDTPLVFESLSTVKNFTVQAEDGTQEQWRLLLVNDAPAIGTTAEITNFRVTRVSNGAIPSDISIDAATRHITISINGLPPFRLASEITTTDGATVSGLSNGTLLFGAYDDQIPLTVTSEDGKTTNIWKISVVKPSKIQLDNSDFESWGVFKDVNVGTFTIDPTPGVGYGWGTANLTMMGIGVQGTKPAKRDDGSKAAEMTTSEQNTLIKGFVVAAGTTYTGVFNFSFDYITQPRKMTNFGIPYTARPTSFDMEVKYAPGAQLKQATLGDDGKYSIHDIAGIDKGHIWIELLQWSGVGAMKYDGTPTEGITVIGRTELIIDGAKNPYTQWTKVTLPMQYNTQYAVLKPTHLAVVFSSSKDGDQFIGAIGSKLTVDNFVINY